MNSVNRSLQIVLGVLRMALGFIFLWAFFDKLLGLGFSTCRNPQTKTIEPICQLAWVNGGSPTFGFLKFATKGPFAEFFKSIAGNPIVDWLFMLGLFGVGISICLGIFIRFSTFFGVLMLGLMYVAGFLPPANNPLIDEHIIYILILIVLYLSEAEKYLGLGRWWQKTQLVEKCRILK